jgi:tyrosyl-tRNA synthetase
MQGAGPDPRRFGSGGCDARVSHSASASAAGLSTFLDDLEWRGILHATTPGLPERLASGRPIRAYIGFDPTADSLHIGHLIPIFGLIRLQEHGGSPVAVVGGGTGMIGDPSGKSSERNLLDIPTLEHNVAAIHAQLERFLDFSPGPTQAAMVNNLDWLGKLSLIEYLRDVGKHFTVPYMLAKESVQLLHRVQLHDPPGVRLRDAVPGARRRAPDGRRGPVGKHHRGPRAHPADRRRSG